MNPEAVSKAMPQWMRYATLRLVGVRVKDYMDGDTRVISCRFPSWFNPAKVAEVREELSGLEGVRVEVSQEERR